MEKGGIGLITELNPEGNDREVGEPMAESKLIRYQLKMLTLCEWVKFCRNLYDTWRARLVLGSRYVNQ